MAQDIDADIEHALMANHGGVDKGRKGIDFICLTHNDGQRPAANWDRVKRIWGCAVCHTGESAEKLAVRLGIAIESPAQRAEKATIVATYDYRDEAGELLYQVVRMQPKDFRQRRPVEDGWDWSLKGVQRVLYRLPELVMSTNSGRGYIFITEGEKDVDRLLKEDLRATTWAGGANARSKGVPAKQKWEARWNKWLAGERVVLLPDNDEAGRDAMNAVAASLYTSGIEVRVLELPGLLGKGDVSDWLFQGGDAGQLVALADETPLWKPPVAPQDAIRLAPAFPETDGGNAELFAHLYGQQVRYDWARGRWLHWERHQWRPDADGRLYRMAKDQARWRARAAADLEGTAAMSAFRFAKSCESVSRIEATLKLARAEHPIADNGQGWDANPMLLGAENGTLDLARGARGGGKVDDRITQSIGYTHEPDAKPVRWLQFLEEVFRGDQEIIGWIKRAVGYGLTGSVREQVWFLCHGAGANGKSVFLNTIRLLGGDYATNMAADTFKKRFGAGSGPTADLARLAGKRIVTCSELAEAAQLDEERVKSLVHGDRQTARFMRENDFEFAPVAKFWIATNHLPDIKDATDGFWRSVRVVPFLRQFGPAEADPALEDKLARELPGILNWALEGAAEWARDGLGTPDQVMMATVGYRQSSDPLGEWKFDHVIFERGAKATPMALYQSYRRWTEAEGYRERDALGRNQFLTRLDGDGYKSEKVHGIRNVYGLRLRTTEDSNVPRGTFPQIQGDVSSSNPGSAPATIELSLREPQKYPRNVPLVPQPNLCPCEDCPSMDDGELGCGGQPLWEDENGLHCPVHHMPE